MIDAKKILAGSGFENVINSALVDAYKAGYAAALDLIAETARAAMERGEAQAAPAAPDVDNRNEQHHSYIGRTTPLSRARRGIVKEVMFAIMAESPGLSISEYEVLACQREPSISSKSVGNELRRAEGRLYVRDVPRGNRWFLKGQRNEEADPDLPSGPTSSLFNRSQEGDDSHAATIATLARP